MGSQYLELCDHSFINRTGAGYKGVAADMLLMNCDVQNHIHASQRLRISLRLLQNDHEAEGAAGRQLLS